MTPGDLVVFALAGGRGVRAGVLSVKAPGYLRSKAVISICGRRVIEWLADLIQAQGVRRMIVIARGLENRYQIKLVMGYGERAGRELWIGYSRPRFDAQNTGSADATLLNLDHWDITDPILVLPTDSLFDLEIAELLAFHSERDALVTIATMLRSPREIAGKYGLVVVDDEGRVTDFVEKPALHVLRQRYADLDDEAFARLQLPTNAGAYLIDSVRLRKLAEDPELQRLRAVSLDFGKDLLPWLVEQGHPVYARPITRVGDLGTLPDYLDSMLDVLHGRFPWMNRLLGEQVAPGLWAHPTTLESRHRSTGPRVEELLDRGEIRIEGSVRLGRYVEVGPGAVLRDCNIDDGVDVEEGCVVERSAVREGVRLGVACAVADSYVGTMSELRSDRDRPTRLDGQVALGDEVTLAAGTHLSGVSIYPRLRIPAEIRLPVGTEVRTPEDVLRYL